MKNSCTRRLLGLALVAASLLVQNAAALINIDTVYVGDIGNAGNGAVNYGYSIGKYEVTISQYTAFLNAVAVTDTYGLYSTAMGTDLNIRGIGRSGSSGSYTYSVIGSGNRPVTYVSWFDSARFANWLHNGQPSGIQAAGTTETGAYTLNGALSGIINRNPDAIYGLPSYAEWNKAAYYQPAAQGGDTDNYWLYATQSNAQPNSRNGSATDPNSANYFRDDIVNSGNLNRGYAVSQSSSYNPNQNYLTDVGAFSLADSFYETFDQNGNVREWTDGIIFGQQRQVFGGSWKSIRIELGAQAPLPTYEGSDTGFRVVLVPEPSTLAFCGAALLGLMVRRKS